MKVFDEFVRWIEGTRFFVRYMENWPEPFNNVSFDAVILLVIIALGVRAVADGIRAYRFRIRLRIKERRLREMEALEARKSRRDDETSELMNQYMKFIMLAQMKNLSSVSGISFEEWMAMKGMAERGEIKAEGDEIKAERGEIKIEGEEANDEANVSSARTDSEIDLEIGDSEGYEEDEDSDTSGSNDAENIVDMESGLVEDDDPDVDGYIEDAGDRESDEIDGDDSLDRDGAEMISMIEEIPAGADEGQQAEDLLDYQSLIDEKRSEENEDEEMINDFFDVYNEMKRNRDEEERLEEMANRESEIRMQNLRALDGKVKKGLVVEGEKPRADGGPEDSVVNADFERRRRKAIKAEEKDAARRAKAEARAEKKAKAEARTEKRAKG